MKFRTYIIETRTYWQAPWSADAIGENVPRSIEACWADVAAFQAGDHGPELAKLFASEANWRITPRLPK